MKCFESKSDQARRRTPLTIMGAAYPVRKGAAAAVLTVPLLLVLSACGQRDAPSTIKRQNVTVISENGPLPAAGAANRLLSEQSAFLRRHADDPVDWYPWGEEAFAKARAGQKLILVSIGYASCPWSQKMKEESFSDPEVARFMNRHYVNVLVDREERPDVNNCYLNFLFWRNKQSGWPLHMWLTPEGLPVFSGVYFPKHSGNNAPSWSLTIEHVANSYADDPAYVKRQAEGITRDYLKEYRKFWNAPAQPLERTALGGGFDKMRSVFDPVNGGFSAAPKFPQPQSLNYLLTYAGRLGQDRMGRGEEALSMVATTLDGILAGAITDHLGGGIHRYSTDVYWAVPQFEKMLYDQGFMAESLTEAALMLDRPGYAAEARATLAYADKELGHPEGGFYCAESASSAVKPGEPEQKEGAFYLWTMKEVEETVKPEALPLIKSLYGLDSLGNMPIDSPVRGRFPDANILKRERQVADVVKNSGMERGRAEQLLEEAHQALLAARGKRPRPMLDDKVLTSWNGIMIAALARAGEAFGDPALTARAVRAADFILTKLRRPDGTLGHAFLDGPSAAPGYAEDYATVIRGLIALYETTGTTRWLRTATELQDKQIELLWDTADAGFFDGPAQPYLFNRIKSVDESTEFAPTAVSTANLLRLHSLTGRADYLEKARAVVKTYGAMAMRAPGGFLRLLQAYGQMVNEPAVAVLTGGPDASGRREILTAVARSHPAGRVVLYADGGEGQEWLAKTNPLLTRLPAAPAGGGAVLHLCRKGAVEQSLTNPADITAALKKAMLESKAD